MRRIEQTAEVREIVELTGQEIQLIVRALTYVASPDGSELSMAEVQLLAAFEELMDNNGLETLDE